jgi:hypothetical protein
MRLLLAPILNFLLFGIQYVYILELCVKKIDLAIIQEDTIFPRRTTYSLYSVQYKLNTQ